MHLGRRFGDVRPSPEADEELTWFFNEAANEIERPSTQGVLLGGHRRGDAEQLEARAEALRAARRIWERLQDVGERDSAVLEALYTNRRWPRALARKWALLVGVADAIPGASREEVVRACGRAVSAYEKVRGPGGSVVPKEEQC